MSQRTHTHYIVCVIIWLIQLHTVDNMNNSATTGGTMTIHKDFKKNLERKSRGDHRRQADRTIKSINIFEAAARNLIRDWEELLGETGNLDYGGENYPKHWDDFDIEVQGLQKWTRAFLEQLRQVK